MKEKRNQQDQETKSYEFPIVVNPMDGGLLPQTPYAYQKQQEFMAQTNSTREDFNVRIGSVQVELDPFRGFKLGAKIDALDQTIIVNKKLTDFLPDFAQNHPIKTNLETVLKDQGFDLNKVTVKSAKLVGPNASVKGRLVGAKGASIGANLGGVELDLQYEGEVNLYNLSIKGMVGKNAGLITTGPTSKQGKLPVASEHKISFSGFKIGFTKRPNTNPKKTSPVTLTPTHSNTLMESSLEASLPNRYQTSYYSTPDYLHSQFKDFSMIGYPKEYTPAYYGELQATGEPRLNIPVTDPMSSNQGFSSFFKNISFLSAANATMQSTRHDSFSNNRIKGTAIMKPRDNEKDQENNPYQTLFKHASKKSNSASSKLSASTKPSQKQITYPSASDPKMTFQTNKSANTKLEQIYKNNAGSTIQVSQILSEIHNSYQTIHELKRLQEQNQKSQLATANFNSAMQGFSLISSIGRECGNKNIERIGTVGLSLVQGTLGIAQLTGSFGVTAVTGFAMAGPIIAVATAALSLGSMLFSSKKGNKEQSKAMQKMFQDLSNQIVQIHHDISIMNKNMIDGFRAVMAGLGTINKNLNIGFNSVHEAMTQHFSNTTKQLTVLAELSNQQYESLSARINKGIEAILASQMSIFKVFQRDFLELDFKFDNQNLFLNIMNEKLSDIQAELQKLGFKDEIAAKNKMFLKLEQFQFQLSLNDKDSGKTKEVLHKLLQSVRGQLLLANNSLKSLEVKDNSFSG